MQSILACPLEQTWQAEFECHENQRPLMQLMADGIIPLNQTDVLMTIGISSSEFDAMLQHISYGTNPFQTWMLANGYSQEIIDKIYQIIDRWLVVKSAGGSFPRRALLRRNKSQI
ncbi:MAG: hypothetical protein PUP92_24930 [Rhizonema sp. PD38]|nr:hypothetical protein [Rhizonema sp. PD38]